jgi:hypothetical protein
MEKKYENHNFRTTTSISMSTKTQKPPVVAIEMYLADLPREEA